MEEASGRVSAELLCPYPPGVPILCPGEYIGQDTLRLLQSVQKMGGIVMGAADESLQTIEVLQ